MHPAPLGGGSLLEMLQIAGQIAEAFEREAEIHAAFSDPRGNFRMHGLQFLRHPQRELKLRASPLIIFERRLDRRGVLFDHHVAERPVHLHRKRRRRIAVHQEVHRGILGE